jgi:hypothetical protein
MFSNSLFSLGLILPLLLLFLGHVVIGLLFSGAAIVVRLRADSSLAARASQAKIDWAIAILASSELLQILGASLLHIETKQGIGIGLLAIGMFLLWPISALLAIWGLGAGRRALLIGHGLIALLVAVLLLSVLLHGWH